MTAFSFSYQNKRSNFVLQTRLFHNSWTELGSILCLFRSVTSWFLLIYFQISKNICECLALAWLYLSGCDKSNLIKLICFEKFAFISVLSINPLWTIDAIWWHRSGSTLAQVMACCLMTLCHYRTLNYVDFTSMTFCGIYLTTILRESSRYQFIKWIWKISLLKFLPHLPGANELILSVVKIRLIEDKFVQYHAIANDIAMRGARTSAGITCTCILYGIDLRGPF